MMADSEVSADTRLLEVIYEEWVASERWPSFAQVDKRLDREGIDVMPALRSAVPELVIAQLAGGAGPSAGSEVRLTLAGLRLLPEAQPLLAALVATIDYLAAREQQHEPSADKPYPTVTSNEVELQLASRALLPTERPEKMVRLIGALVNQEGALYRSHGVLNPQLGTWDVEPDRDIRTFRGVTDVDDFLERKAELLAGRGQGLAVSIGVAASEGSAPDDGDELQYDVALSFAGEDRAYVEAVADGLRAAGVSVFYDRFYEAETWGVDLYAHLHDIYNQQARYTVAFVSVHYVNKPWTNHERQSAQARALLEGPTPYLLPVRLDDSELPGMPATIGYVDGRTRAPSELVELIIRKLGGASEATPVERTLQRVPRTHQERQLLLMHRQPGWEYLLFGADLLAGLEQLQPEWRDFEARYATPSGRYLSRDEAVPYLEAALHRSTSYVNAAMRLFEPAVHERAFGKPGEPGDAERIAHLAQRLSDLYRNLLAWAAELRGTATEDVFRPLLEATADLVVGPVEQYRAFVQDCVRQIDEIPAHISADTGEPLRVTLELVLAINDDDQARLTAAFEQVNRDLAAG